MPSSKFRVPSSEFQLGKRTIRYLRRILVALLVFCSLMWAGCVGFLWANETRIVFRTHLSRAVANAATVTVSRTRQLESTAFAPLHLVTADGLRLEAVTLTAGAPGDGYWIVFFHGSAHSIHSGRVRDQLRALHVLGYNVLALDYRGFGRNEGTPTEAGLYEDALAAYRHLTDDLGVGSSRVILAGRSLGSAIAIELATRVRSAGVLLFSPIDSIALMGARMYPWMPVRYLASSRFDAIAKIERVHEPVVLVHAVNDRWVPLAAARALFARAVAPKLMLETAGGHNGAGFADINPLREALARFWPSSAPDGHAALAAAQP